MVEESDGAKHLSGSDEGAGNVAEPDTARSLLAEARAASIARLDAELLLSGVSRRSRAQLLAFDDEPVDPLTAALFRAALERRAAGEPLAYITGIKEFWSLPLVVTPAVLVPRPDTELLVERCLAQLDAAPRRVADLGTGTLAIAAALARERPQWQIVATDRSEAALEVAAINRSRLQLPHVELRKGDWCAALPDATAPGREHLRFDAILSNPPYIGEQDPALTALTHEPVEALVAADEGYADLFIIAADSREHLKPGGLLLLEHGANQAPRLQTELVRLGYARVVSHRDLAGLDRVTEAFWS